MIKVLYIISNFRRTGPTRQLLNIISGLQPDKVEVEILSLSPEPADTMINDFKKLPVHISSLSLSRLEGLFLSRPKLTQILKRSKPDIIHTQGIRPDVLASGIKNIPHVATVRNDPFVDYPSKFGKLKGYLMASQHIKTTRKLPSPVACSVSLSHAFQEKYNIQMQAIQNGVDTNKYTVAGKVEKSSIRRKLQLDQGKAYFISVGSLIPRKNTEVLIKAFKKNTSANLVLLGDGPEREQLENASEGSPNISFRGNVPDAGEYLKAADFFVSASKGEGLPNTVMEAISSGLPVLLSDIEAHREIFLRDSYDYYFPPDDTATLIRKINDLQQEDYEQFSQRMRKIAESNFSANFMAGKYQELYFKLLS